MTQQAIQLSKKAQRFIEHNAKHAIYKAAWLDNDGEEPYGPRETWAKFRAWFEGGTVRTITSDEHGAILTAGYSIRWTGKTA